MLDLFRPRRMTYSFHPKFWQQRRLSLRAHDRAKEKRSSESHREPPYSSPTTMMRKNKVRSNKQGEERLSPCLAGVTLLSASREP